ncbi:MAG TPA: hypothetical protein VGL09_16305 [Methylomirabilota bacterium]|jgi:hypothetical protein
MQPSVYNALAVSIIVSAAGALAMCFLLFRYGFTTSTGGARRTVIIRLGHAFAAVCFTITAVLAAVALSAPPRPHAAQGPTAGRAEVEMMTEEVRTLARRVDSAESALRQVTAKSTAPVAAPDQPAAAAQGPVATERPGAPPDKSVAATTRAVPPVQEPPAAPPAVKETPRRPSPAPASRVETVPPPRRDALASARPASPAPETASEARRTPTRAIPPPTIVREPSASEALKNPSAPSNAPAGRDWQSTALTEQTPPSALADTQVIPRSAVPAPAPTPSPSAPASSASSARVEPSTPAPRVEPSRVEPAPRVEPPRTDRNVAATTTPPTPKTTPAPAPSARPARDPSTPLSWDESIAETNEIGRNIKDTVTTWGRKLKGVFGK